MRSFQISSPESLSGKTHLPGDKSISHRAVMISSISEGMVTVSNFLHSEDCMRTVECMRGLGVEISESPAGLTIRGVGLSGLKSPKDILFVGNSGTTIRLLLGILAGQQFKTTITGDESIKRRPMGRVVEPLKLMGAKVSGREKGALAPITIEGKSLKPIEYELPIASAQVKSAILLAGLYSTGKTRIIEKIKTRDHTERMLEHFGAKIEVGDGKISIEGGARLNAESIDVPSDISSAAYVLVAAALIPGSDVTLTGVGVNPGRTGIIDVLHRMGANMEISSERIVSGEPVADIRVRHSRLRAIEIGGNIIPRLIDEIPIIALAATQAEGETVIRGAGELRVKESDRITTTSRELKRLGANIRELRDGMVIRGGVKLKGGLTQSYGDHRVAMTCAIAGLLASSGVRVQNIDCVYTSFPVFDKFLNELSGGESVKVV
jgi:3-phosphoshikimate 1-carboxyvinyltransferase